MLKIILVSLWQIDHQLILISFTSKVTTISKDYLHFLVVESTKRQTQIQEIEFSVRMFTLKAVLEDQAASGNTELLVQLQIYLQVTMVTIKMKIKFLISRMQEKIELKFFRDQLHIH